MQQGRIFDIINEMIKEKAGLETKEAQELKKTLDQMFLFFSILKFSKKL